MIKDIETSAPTNASTPHERLLMALSHRTPDRISFTWGDGAAPERVATLRAHLAPQGIDWRKRQAATEDKIHVASANTKAPGSRRAVDRER